MIDRLLFSKIKNALATNPAVAILGPRQIGKTTLAFELSKNIPSVYLDLQNPDDFQKLQNPIQYFNLHADKLIIIDEVQIYPDLFKSLRGVIDQRRREGRGKGCFLILGSASNDLLKQSSESLAGRISYNELGGINMMELSTHMRSSMEQLWVRGGFPESYLKEDSLDSYDWRQQFIKTYLERDIPLLGPRIPATTLLRFWTMLAHLQGELFNAAQIAVSLGVESITVSRYLDLMVDLLLVRRLQPWSGNVKKRLVKSPKIYIRDTGLLHTLLKVHHYEDLLSHPVYGHSWEGFVIENILSLIPSHIQSYFYRSSAGAEIDLLLEIDHQQYWAIEIKASSSPKLQKGYFNACEDLQPTKKFIIYPGEDQFYLANDVLVCPLKDFLTMLSSVS